MAANKTSKFDVATMGLTFGEDKKTTPIINNIEKEEKAVRQVKTEEESIQKSEPKQSPKKKSSEVEFSFKFEKKKKETLSVHKSFKISASKNEKFVKMAEEYGMSENELFNKILDSIFA